LLEPGRNAGPRRSLCALAVTFARSSLLAERARLMRAEPHPDEARLWAAINAGQLAVVVRRQLVVGGRFIADFYVAAARLIIEVDGAYPIARRSADRRRDEKLRRLGYRTLRIDSELVPRYLAVAVALVRAALARPPLLRAECDAILRPAPEGLPASALPPCGERKRDVLFEADFAARLRARSGEARVRVACENVWEGFLRAS
jgi:very-short-patch-repair endonuclease